LGPINYWLVLGHEAHDHKNSEAHLNLLFSSSNKYQLDLFIIIIIYTNNTERPNAENSHKFFWKGKSKQKDGRRDGEKRCFANYWNVSSAA
jgi:hypothetical protein